MDDKWFCFVEGDRLFVHRSWTGNEIFRADLLQESNAGAVIEMVVRNDDRAQFNVDDTKAVSIFDSLLDRLVGPAR